MRESAIVRLLGAPATERVVIADAETEADLAAAVARMNAAGGEWVAVGSGALARAVVGAGATRPANRPARPASGDGGAAVLFVCGSAHPVNRAQAARLAEASGMLVRAIASDGRPAETTGVESAAMVAEELRMGRMAGLQLAMRGGAGDFATSRAALHAIVAAARVAIAGSGVRRLMVTGGETAFALCRALGLDALRVMSEIEPGLVLAEAGASGFWRLAIKPGGFGSEAAWVKAGEALRSA